MTISNIINNTTISIIFQLVKTSSIENDLFNDNVSIYDDDSLEKDSLEVISINDDSLEDDFSNC